MALPKHIKQLAMDAVAGRQTTEWIRLHSSDGASDSQPMEAASGNAGHPGKLALKIISKNEILRNVRLVEADRITVPWPTPNPKAQMDSSWLAELRRSARSAAAAMEAEREAGRDEMERGHGR